MTMRKYQPTQLRAQWTIARAVAGAALCVMMVLLEWRVLPARAIATNPSPLESRAKVSPLRVLDLFCGAGGASMGYHLAGYRVVGVDIAPMPRYPFEFHQADALEYLASHGKEFDVIHASPPCQAYTRMYSGLLQSMGTAKEHPKLIEAVRCALLKTGKPYVIENVPGAPLINPIRLCGSSFGLLVQRHRLFESNMFLLGLPCAHGWQKLDKPPLHQSQGVSRVVGVYGNGRGKGDNKALWQHAMQINWMRRKELTQAIPPVYTKYIGELLLANSALLSNTASAPAINANH